MRAPVPTPDPHIDGVGSHAPAAVQSLKQAMRRARGDNAERSGVVTDLRVAQLGRLELLQEALKPLIAQIPAGVDLFDLGLMPGATPRLFIDMIGFLELGRDARVYHFFQDTRHGRVTLAETADVETMVEAVTDYVARRLLEREKALAADRPQRLDSPRPTARREEDHATCSTAPATNLSQSDPAKALAPDMGRAPRSAWRWLGITFAFVIDLLGSIAFFMLLAAVIWVAWNRMHTPL